MLWRSHFEYLYDNMCFFFNFQLLPLVVLSFARRKKKDHDVAEIFFIILSITVT